MAGGMGDQFSGMGALAQQQAMSHSSQMQAALMQAQMQHCRMCYNMMPIGHGPDGKFCYSCGPRAEANRRQAAAALVAQQPKIFVERGTELLNKIIPDNAVLTLKENKVLGLYGNMKNYLSKHSDIIFTVVLVMLADKFFFNGVFKNTLQGIVNKLLTRAEKEVGE